MSTLSQKRESLAADQDALLAHLVGTESAPQGFDVSRLAEVREGLRNKRALQLALAWPTLVRPLGEEFPAHFDTFARSVAAPPVADGIVDGRRFARYLADVGALSDAGRAQALAFDLRYRLDHRGVSARRGFGIRIAVLRRPRYLAVGLRSRPQRDKVFLVPLGRRRLSAPTRPRTGDR
jgi:hypothetical protein